MILYQIMQMVFILFKYFCIYSNIYDSIQILLKFTQIISKLNQEEKRL